MNSGKITNSNTRFVADVYNNLTETRLYYPILSSSTSFPELLESRKKKIIHLLLNNFPIPKEDTSWEKIIDFKEKNKSLLYKLRYDNWIIDLTHSKLSIVEIEHRLKYFTAEYENRLKLEKIKYSYKSIGYIILEGLKLVEDIVKFNWSKRLEGLLTFKKAEIDLLIGETKAGGKEIAYMNQINKEL